MRMKELKQLILRKLESTEGRVSGEILANETGFSRTYIWKAVNSLRTDGYNINAVQNGGYSLEKQSDTIDILSLRKYLKDDLKNIRIDRHNVTASTNSLARKLAENKCDEWTVVIAREQTEGRGRGDHTFFSPADTGIYMSIVLRPTLPAKDALLLTTATSVAVADAIETVCHKKVGIKWVNDIFIDGKKVGGILTESSLSLEKGCINYAIIGIGINVLPPKNGFPSSITDTAAAVTDCAEKDLESRIVASILNNLSQYYQCLSYKSYYEGYKNRLFFLGTPITVIKNNALYSAIATDIDEDFRLLVVYPDGTKEALSSGEISIKTY